MSIEARFRLQRGDDFLLDVDLTLADRGVTAIFGPSGCGKTTLLRAIAGLEPCRNATLKVAGKTWQDETTTLPAHKRPVGYVFQEASLFPHLTARQNIEYGLKRIALSAQKISMADAVSLLGLDHLLGRKPAQLSGGERQRVAIARALAVSPGILLMDEPLAALDLQRKQEIMPYLESLHRELEIPILYVSHAPGEVARLADDMVLLNNGKVQAHGPTTELFTRLDLPLAHSDKAAALIEATVTEHDDRYALTLLDFSGGRFTVSRKNLPLGHHARLRVIARDVSLTLARQRDTSILNIFPATVQAISTSESLRTLGPGWASRAVCTISACWSLWACRAGCPIGTCQSLRTLRACWSSGAVCTISAC
jgi:molybdate transport system ATP-binding protein